MMSEATKSLKYHINFLKTLINHINGKDEELRVIALISANCIHRWMRESFIDEVKQFQQSMVENTLKSSDYKSILN
jgi:hypothetical protein